MKKKVFLAFAVIMALSFSSCKKSSSDYSGLMALLSMNGGSGNLSIISTVPSNNMTNVLRNCAIVVNFSESVSAATVNTASFSISPSVSGTFNVTNNCVIFTPGALLSAGTLYTVTISTGIESSVISGRFLKSPLSFSFTTGTTTDSTAPTVLSTSPPDSATGVGVNQAIVITFSEAINPSSVTGHYAISGSVTATPNVAGSVLTLTPATALAYDTDYTVTLTAGGIEDLAGNHIASQFQFSFKTGYLPDTTPPSAIMPIPLNGSTSAALNTYIEIMFSEAILSNSVNASSFSISPPVTGTFEVNDMMVAFKPSSNLSPSTTYTVTLPAGGIKDLAGNGLSSQYQFQFTAGTAADNTPPQAASTYPVGGTGGVSQNVAVWITFYDNLLSTSITSLSVTVKDNADSSDVAGTLVGFGGLIIFQPRHNAFQLTHTYTITCKGGTGADTIKDMSGNKLAADYSFSFTIENVADTTPLAFVSSIPSDGANGVSTAPVITIQFDDDVAGSSLQPGMSILFQDASHSDIPFAALAFTAGKIQLMPLTYLTNNTTYTITIKGTGANRVTDDMGNSMTSDVSFSFTTTP